MMQPHREDIKNFSFKNSSPRWRSSQRIFSSKQGGKVTFGLSLEIWQNNFTDDAG